MLSKLKRALVSRYWSRWADEGGTRTWMHEPLVRAYINHSVSGAEEVWPMDWFHGRYPAGFPHGLSLGCGDGALERDVLGRRMCQSVLGLDIAAGALEVARAEAARAGIKGAEYREADLNVNFDLSPESFDIAFFHQALHHIDALDLCLGQVRESLRPGGIFYLDEYVGPSRAHWQRQLMADADRLFKKLPKHLRRRRRLQLPLDWRDPSEAIRSAEIMPAVGRHFEIQEERAYGGNLLAIVYPHLRVETEDQAGLQEVLAMLIEEERKLLTEGANSFYVVAIARRPE